MRVRWILWLFVLALIPLGGISAQTALGSWNAPSGIYNTWVVFPSTNASATRVIFLNPYSTTSGATEWFYDRQVLFTEYVGGAWSTPVAVGSNGMYRPTGLLPIVTRPVISADGSTIAYVGCTGNCKPFSQGDRYDIYVSHRGPGGWSQPAVAPSDPGAIRPQIGLSANGKTLAYCTAYFFSDLLNRVYIIQGAGETWGSPTAVSRDNVNAFYPALSRDGKQVIWRSSPLAGGLDVLYFANQLPDGSWSDPQILNSNLILGINVADYYNFSPDGNSIFYWNVATGDSDPNVIHLYVMRRVGSAWSSSQQVTPGVLAYTNEGLTVALNFDGTRVIYPDPLAHENFINDVSLEMVEYKSGTWGAPAAVTVHKQDHIYLSPMMSDDGKRLVAQGPSAAYEGSGVILFLYTEKYFSYFPFMIKE
jgi:Tol biopolymer transport system component